MTGCAITTADGQLITIVSIGLFGSIYRLNTLILPVGFLVIESQQPTSQHYSNQPTNNSYKNLKVNWSVTKKRLNGWRMNVSIKFKKQ